MRALSHRQRPRLAYTGLPIWYSSRTKSMQLPIAIHALSDLLSDNVHDGCCGANLSTLVLVLDVASRCHRTALTARMSTDSDALSC